jgi:hypothetical protein
VYSGTWYGPSQSFGYDYGNQSSAVDLLLSGILVNPTPSSSNTTSSTMPLPTGSATTNGTHRANVGAIVGGAVGGFVVLLMMVALVALIILQRRRRASMKAHAQAEPFLATSHDSPRPVTPQDESAQLKQSVATETPSFSTTPSTVDEGGQRITVGSLLWELNELVRSSRGNRSAHDDDAGPPAYTTA